MIRVITLYSIYEKQSVLHNLKIIVKINTSKMLTLRYNKPDFLRCRNIYKFAIATCIALFILAVHTRHNNADKNLCCNCFYLLTFCSAHAINIQTRAQGLKDAHLKQNRKDIRRFLKIFLS